MTVWGVHNDHPELDLVANGFIGIGWDEVGDLAAIGSDKELMKQHVAAARPTAKPGAIPVWAGVLLRFAFEMQIGDFVIYPYKPDSTLNFGLASIVRLYRIFWSRWRRMTPQVVP